MENEHHRQQQQQKNVEIIGSNIIFPEPQTPRRIH